MMIGMMRPVTAIGLAVALFAGASPALAASAGALAAMPIEQAATELSPNQFVWKDNGASEPVSIVISLLEQRAFVYRGASMIAATTISSGKDGKDTPLGTYPILQKNAVHKSSLYDDASMPFMQRLTWDGIAIHAGRNPGFPASHGCIRVPLGFAKQLFGVTTLGTTVTVTDDFEGGAMPEAPVVDQETAVANLRQSVSLDR
ncbi:lipoprotein-anchoring transpeptidase ErfK/SrfK [Sphingomonas sp. PP-F2F-G114-C0414]|uniref:L,D-transpeptidase family protein n=1 Tax=Sphingomonas sp. PP-F2F-G114-C0414 TaxID=2135662 RepID=UPI000F177094|nr:L,D-transpeptidase family protein [Sphingomonas sp. PP-F2F-G114-C0414]RMB24840.1 lipoprotein-anchoring transpeptidase ErfK/SrfK [Sphingomonas sp. PP-F2F-G114-C0414]